jgi:hypothetical protein
MNEKITILSGKAPYYYYERKVKIFCKTLLKKFRGYNPSPGELAMYGGHYGVTRSMIEGLQKIGYTNFNYNPSSLSQIGDIVLVVGGIPALQQAIKWKKSGKIKQLIAGPNLCILPTDYPEIASPEINTYIVHADWNVEQYENLCPALKGKMAKWPVGIDINYWKPQEGQLKTGKKILFYKKTVEEYLYNECLTIAKKNGFEVIELIRGGYSFDQYKNLLNEVDFLIHFANSESQGISLAEAWGMNVPTMVFNPGIWSYKGYNFPCSSAPLLTDSTGHFFNNSNGFKDLFQTNKFSSALYAPRQWTTENLTDERSAAILLNIINAK